MNINWNLNRLFENKNTGTFFKILIISTAIVFAFIMIYLTMNGNHNKMPGFETNIEVKPKDSTNKHPDSLAKTNNEYLIDSTKPQKENVIRNNNTSTINIKEHKGDIIFRDKVTYNK